MKIESCTVSKPVNAVRKRHIGMKKWQVVTRECTLPFVDIAVKVTRIQCSHNSGM